MTFKLSVISPCDAAIITSTPIHDQVYILNAKQSANVDFALFAHDLMIDCGVFSYEI